METHQVLPLTCESMPGLVFQVAQVCESEEIFEFLMSHFFPEVPTFKLVDMDAEKEARPWALKYVQVLVANLNTITVRDTLNGNRLAGVSLNALDHGHDADEFNIVKYVDPVKYPLFWKSMEFLNQLYEGINLHHLFQADSVLHLAFVSVSPHYARRGIAAKLVQVTIHLAKSKGVKVLAAEAVSHFAGRAFIQNGFHSVKDLSYNDFQCDGQRPFVNDGVHQKGQLLVLRIP